MGRTPQNATHPAHTAHTHQGPRETTTHTHKRRKNTQQTQAQGKTKGCRGAPRKRYPYTTPETPTHPHSQETGHHPSNVHTLQGSACHLKDTQTQESTERIQPASPGMPQSKCPRGNLDCNIPGQAGRSHSRESYPNFTPSRNKKIKIKPFLPCPPISLCPPL